ncbi:hypothetical protein OKN36_05420 [Furfurilactobacillus sp. OKN36]
MLPNGANIKKDLHLNELNVNFNGIKCLLRLNDWEGGDDENEC